MKLKELKDIIKQHPEISLISLTCKRFPNWKGLSSYNSPTARYLYVGDIMIFIHLEKGENL